MGLNFSAPPHPPVPDPVTRTQVSIARSLSEIQIFEDIMDMTYFGRAAGAKILTF